MPAAFLATNLVLLSAGLPITSNRISWKRSTGDIFLDSSIWLVYRLLQIGLVGNCVSGSIVCVQSMPVYRLLQIGLVGNLSAHLRTSSGSQVSKCLPITSNRISWKLTPRIERGLKPLKVHVYRLLQIGLVGNKCSIDKVRSPVKPDGLPITSNRISWKRLPYSPRPFRNSHVVYRLLQIGLVGNWNNIRMSVSSAVSLPITSNRISWKLYSVPFLCGYWHV